MFRIDSYRVTREMGDDANDGTTASGLSSKARHGTAGKDGNGDRRLDMWVSMEAYLALARLARRYSVTKRQMLERLIVRADDAIVRRLDPNSEQWGQYFGPER